MSLSCSVGTRGDVEWWLTRESGWVPQPCCREEGEDGIFIKVPRVQRVSPKVYVALVVGEEGVVFAELSSDSLSVLLCRVMPAVQEVVMSREPMAVADWLSGFWLGLFSSGVACGCDVDAVCDSCGALNVGQGRFVEQGRYMGLYPCGSAHWWSGVSDAAGEWWSATESCLTCREDVSWKVVQR